MSVERERGRAAALELIAAESEQAIRRNYANSAAAPDQTDFDRGYRETIREHWNQLSNKEK